MGAPEMARMPWKKLLPAYGVTQGHRTDGQGHYRSGAAQIRAMGVAHIPANRTATGLVMDFPLSDSRLLGHQYRSIFRNGPFINRKAVNEWINRLIKDFNIKAPHSMLLPSLYQAAISRSSSSPERWYMSHGSCWLCSPLVEWTSHLSK